MAQRKAPGAFDRKLWSRVPERRFRSQTHFQSIEVVQPVVYQRPNANPSVAEVDLPQINLASVRVAILLVLPSKIGG